MWSCERWKSNLLNWEKSQKNSDGKSCRTISGTASADFTNGQINHKDSLVQMTTVSYRRILSQQRLAITFKKCLADEKIKKHRIHFLSTSAYLTIKNKQLLCLRVLCKARVICCANRDKLQKQNSRTLEKIKTCGREGVLELPAVLLPLWVNIC